MALYVFFMFLLVSCGHSLKTDISDKRGGSHWTAGYGQAELIPPNMDGQTYYIAGYKPGLEITGVLDYQMAKALWLDDNSGNGGVLIVAVDCIGLSRTDVNIIRRMLNDFKTETGCRSINVIATHTHAGVDTLGIWGPNGISGRSPGFMQALYNGAVSAALQAYNARRDGALFYGSALTEGIQSDSRPPLVYDPAVHSLRFVPNGGGNGIRVINYAAHPEALGSRNTFISADFPVYLAAHIRQSTGDNVMFIPAAIGGLITVKHQSGDNGENLSVVDSAIMVGERLADFTLGIADETELPPYMAVHSKEVLLPVDNDTFVISLFLGILREETLPRGGKYRLSMVTEVGLLELGELRIVLVPGELFPELAYGGAIGDTGVNPSTLANMVEEGFLIFGLCNDEIGYIVPPSDFFLNESYPYLKRGTDKLGRSHYEETNSVGPLTAGLIIEALEELINTGS